VKPFIAMKVNDSGLFVNAPIRGAEWRAGRLRGSSSVDLGVPNVHRARPKEPHSTFNVIDDSRVITLLSEDGAPCSSLLA